MNRDRGHMPQRVAQLSSRTPKAGLDSRGFDSWLGHVQEATDQCFSLSLSKKSMKTYPYFKERQGIYLSPKLSSSVFVALSLLHWKMNSRGLGCSQPLWIPGDTWDTPQDTPCT